MMTMIIIIIITGWYPSWHSTAAIDTTHDESDTRTCDYRMNEGFHLINFQHSRCLFHVLQLRCPERYRFWLSLSAVGSPPILSTLDRLIRVKFSRFRPQIIMTFFVFVLLLLSIRRSVIKFLFDSVPSQSSDWQTRVHCCSNNVNKIYFNIISFPS